MMISDWVSDKNFLTSLMTTSMLYVTRTPWHTLRSSCTRMSITLCPQHKLLVDGQGLSLSKRPSDAWDANLIGCRIMGSRPNNLFCHNFLRVAQTSIFFCLRDDNLSRGSLPQSFWDQTEFFPLYGLPFVSQPVSRPWNPSKMKRGTRTTTTTRGIPSSSSSFSVVVVAAGISCRSLWLCCWWWDLI